MKKKMKKILFAAIIAITMMTNCTKGPDKQPESDKTAYISLNLSGLKIKNKANPGTSSGEDYVNDITILLFDGSNKFLDIKTPALTDFTHINNTYQSISAFLVPLETKKVFVVVNNKEADGATLRFTMPSLPGDSGKDWSVINTTLSYNPSPIDNVNGFIGKITGKTTNGGNDNYTMANFGVRAANDNGLVPVITGKTPEEAKLHPNTIYVDRLTSKIGFKISEIGTIGNGEIVALPANAKFFFKGWELNATNRKIRLYSPHEALYTGTIDPTVPLAGMVAYRVDANYTKASYGISGSSWTGFENQFVFLRNIGTDGLGTTSTVSSSAGIVKYCPENTMESVAQLIGATTKVIVKGNYVPAFNKSNGLFAANESYFSYAGDYYTLNEIKNAYVTSVASGHTQGLAKEMDAFMKAALLVSSSATDLEIEAAVAALTTNSFDANKGIIARLSNAVRYFHEGISYYSILVRHDQNINDAMALGKYGTVRNNWYELTLNKVTKPGTPWIPGGPDDPTDPETPDDIDAYLDVTITINPWITWQQGIDL